MLYTPKQATQITGASASSLRNYTSAYARYFSTEATSTPRKFTDADLKLIAFIMHLTKERGMKHAEVAEALQSGELDNFTWEPSESEPEFQEIGSESFESTALVPLANLQAAQLLLQEAQRREEAAIERQRELQARIEELVRELGEAKGELKAIQNRRPPWFRRIFGG